MIFCEAIDEQVVYDRAFRRGDGGILRLPVNELGGVVRDQAIDLPDGIGPAHVYLAHVRDIEKPCTRARPQVLFDRPQRVLDRHVPPAEIHHAPAHPAVHGVERSLFQIGRRQSVSPTYLSASQNQYEHS